MAIPTADGSQYPCTHAAADAAHELTAQAWADYPELRQSLTRKAFDRTSFRAVGQTIQESVAALPPNCAGDNFVADEFYAALAKDYCKNLETLADRVRVDLDRHIPCSLFHRDQIVPAFAVGPVEFRPRLEWVSRFVADPPVIDWIEQFDCGEITKEDLRRRIHEEQDDTGESEALEILDFLGAHAWVATVRIEAHEPARSHEKASVIVGLAIDAIGLRFALDDARAFVIAGRQHRFNEARLATSTTGSRLRGWSAARRGIGGRPGMLAAKMASEQSFLDEAGTLLSEFLRARGSGRAAHLVERWTNALYWFGEARREASDFMAVVDYGCAADGLSGAGGKVRVMQEFAMAALHEKGQAAGHLGISAAEAVRRVYAEGRNKLAHGEAYGLFEDLQELRAIGDNLLVALLNQVTPILADALKRCDRILGVDEKHAYQALLVRLKAASGS